MRPVHPLWSVALLLCVVGGAPPVLAQDAFYWRDSYGTEATLLNGTVIGRPLDLGAVFYNPAGLASARNSELVLSTQVYEFNVLSGSGNDVFTGEPLELRQAVIRPAPSFFGGTVPLRALGRHRLGYSALTRQQVDNRLVARLGDVVGDDLVQAEYLNDNRLNEVWVGATWAYPLLPRVSVGATAFVAVRSQLLRRQVTVQQLGDAGDVGLAVAAQEFQYNSWRIVPKLGATVDLSPVTFGVVVTVPSLGLWGSGSTLFNLTSAGIDFDGDGAIDDRLVSNLQEDLASDFYSGLAVGAGTAVDVGETTIFASGEWYAPRGPTRVVASEPFIGQSTGETYSTDLVLRTRGVLNVGVGVRHYFAPRFAGYFSATTDFSATDTTLAVSVGQSLWDLYHLGTGAKLVVGSVELVLGLSYTFGSEQVELGQGSSIELLEGTSVRLRERGIQVLFGFQYGFGRGRREGGAPTASPDA